VSRAQLLRQADEFVLQLKGTEFEQRLLARAGDGGDLFIVSDSTGDSHVFRLQKLVELSFVSQPLVITRS